MYENVKAEKLSPISGVFASVLKGILLACAVTLVIFALASVILSYTPLSESAIPYIVFATHIVGSVIAGFIPAKKAGVKGLLTGAASALLYMLILWLVSSLASDGFYFNSHVLTMVLLSAASGAFGGITGVNFKDTISNKKKR